MKRSAEDNVSRFVNWLAEQFHVIASWLRQKFKDAQQKIKEVIESVTNFVTENLVEPLQKAINGFIKSITKMH